MTYCVALRLNRGLVFAADTRTSAGTANVAQYRKLHYWRKPGERVIVLLSAGNLAVTQSVVSLLNEQLVQEQPAAEGHSSLFTVASLYRAARLVGDAVREMRRIDGAALEDTSSGFNATFILGRPDRLRGAAAVPASIPRATSSRRPTTRRSSRSASTSTASRSWIGWRNPACVWARRPRWCCCRSIRPLRSNLSVGLPIDLLIYERDSLDVRREKRIEQEDEYFRKLSAAWSDALRSAFSKMEEFKV